MVIQTFIWIAWTFIVYRFISVLFNIFTKIRLSKTNVGTDDTLISILVPARNEAKNLHNVIRSVLSQKHSNLELLIYDDQSTDSTASIVHHFEKLDSRIRLLEGKQLPEGWTGKNHACHHLATVAQGKYFFFIDADVSLHHSFISKMISRLKKNNLPFISVFPYQKMHTVGERLTVPIMNQILLSLLPLKFVNWFRFPSMAAANGQFMGFEATFYRKHQWHSHFKNTVVEDIDIAREVKQKGYRMETLLGDKESLSCRMYHSYSEAIEGFSKNIHHFFGGKIMLLLTFDLMILMAPLLIYFKEGIIPAGVYLILNTIIIVLIRIISGTVNFLDLLLQPFQFIALFHITFKALISNQRKRIIWKNRPIRFS